MNAGKNLKVFGPKGWWSFGASITASSNITTAIFIVDGGAADTSKWPDGSVNMETLSKIADAIPNSAMSVTDNNYTKMRVWRWTGNGTPTFSWSFGTSFAGVAIVIGA